MIQRAGDAGAYASGQRQQQCQRQGVAAPGRALAGAAPLLCDKARHGLALQSASHSNATTTRAWIIS